MQLGDVVVLSIDLANLLKLLNTAQTSEPVVGQVDGLQTCELVDVHGNLG